MPDLSLNSPNFTASMSCRRNTSASRFQKHPTATLIRSVSPSNPPRRASRIARVENRTRSRRHLASRAPSIRSSIVAIVLRRRVSNSRARFHACAATEGLFMGHDSSTTPYHTTSRGAIPRARPRARCSARAPPHTPPRSRRTHAEMSAPTTMFTTQSTSALRAGPARSRATVRAPTRASSRNPRVTSRDGARSRRATTTTTTTFIANGKTDVKELFPVRSQTKPRATTAQAVRARANSFIRRDPGREGGDGARDVDASRARRAGGGETLRRARWVLFLRSIARGARRGGRARRPGNPRATRARGVTGHEETETD